MSRRDRGSAQQILAVTLAVVMLVSMGGMAFVGGASAQTGGTYDEVFDGSTDVSGDLNLADGQVRAVGPSGGDDVTVTDDGSVDLTGTGNDGQFVGVELTPDRIQELSDVSANPAEAPATFLDEAPAEFDTNTDSGNSPTTSAVFVELAPQSNISQISGVDGSHDFIIVATVPSTSGDQVDGLVNTNVANGDSPGSATLSEGDIVALSVDNDDVSGGAAGSTLLASGSDYGAVFDELVGQSTSDLQNENVDDFQFVAGTFNDNTPTLDQVRLGDDVSTFADGQTVHSEKITLVDADDDSERYFNTIENADTEAGTDDTILLDDGAYGSNIELDTAGLSVEPDADGDVPTIEGILTYDAADVTVDGLEIDTGSVTDDDGVTNPTLTNTAVSSDANPAVDFADTSDATVTNNTIVDDGDTTNVAAGTGLDVSGGFATVTGNDIQGFQTQIAATTSADVTALVADNDFEGNANAQAAVPVNDSGGVTSAAVFGSVDEADTEAAAGETVEVYSGTYEHGGVIDITTDDVALDDVEGAAEIQDEVDLNAAGDVSVDGFHLNSNNLDTNANPSTLTVNNTAAGDFNLGSIADVTLDGTTGAVYTIDGTNADISGATGNNFQVTATDNVAVADVTVTETGDDEIVIDSSASGDISVVDSVINMDDPQTGVDITSANVNTAESVTVSNVTVNADGVAATGVSIANIDTDTGTNPYVINDSDIVVGNGVGIDVDEVAGDTDGSLIIDNNEITGGDTLTGIAYNMPDTESVNMTNNVIIGSDTAGGAASVGVDFEEVSEFGSGLFDPGANVMTFEDNTISGHARLIQDGSNGAATVSENDYTAVVNELNNDLGTLVIGPDGEYEATFGPIGNFDLNNGDTASYLPGSVSQANALVQDNIDNADEPLETTTLEVRDPTDVDVGPAPDVYAESGDGDGNNGDGTVTFPNMERVTLTGENPSVTVQTNFELAEGDAENNHDITSLTIESGADTAIDVVSDSSQSTFEDLTVTSTGAGLVVDADGADVNVIEVSDSSFEVDGDGIALSSGSGTAPAADDRDGFVLDNVSVIGNGIGNGDTGLDLTGVAKPGKDGLGVNLTIEGSDVSDFGTQVAVSDATDPDMTALDVVEETVSIDGVTIQNNEFEQAVLVLESDGSDAGENLFGSINAADGAADPSQTIDIRNTFDDGSTAVYDHASDVTIDTNGVTVTGPTTGAGAANRSEAVVIQDPLAVGANNDSSTSTGVTIEGLAVVPNQAPSGSGSAVINYAGSGALTVDAVSVSTDLDTSTSLPTGVGAESGADALTVTNTFVGDHEAGTTTGTGVDAGSNVDLSVTDSTLAGGNGGPGVSAATGTTPELTDTTVQNFDQAGVQTAAESLTITGGEISTNGAAGVTDDGVTAPATQYDITGTTIANNADGVSLTEVGLNLTDATVDANTNGVVVSGAETVNVTNATVTANTGDDAAGIAVTDGNVTVTESTVTDNGAGVVFDLGDAGGSELTRTELADNSDGLRVESGAAELTVTGNDFANENTDIVNNDGDTLDATLNFFGTDRGPEAAAGVDEDVVYDPFLTTDQTDSTVAAITETTDFGHDIIVDGNSVTTIGFPAQPAAPAGESATLDQFLDSDMEGTVYGFDRDTEEFTSLDETEQANTEVTAFDAFVVENTQTAAETIAVTYEDDPGATGVVDSRYEFQAGLNFVAPAQAGTVEESLLVGQPTDQVIQPFELGGNLYGTDAAQVRDSFVSPDGTFADSYETGAGDRIVHPHAGYLVDVNPDDITPGAGLFPSISTATAPATADTVAAQTDNAPVATNVNTGESYNNLQSAFADAEPGAQIQLGPGTALLDAAGARDELSVSTSDLTVTGAGTAVTTVDGSLEFTGANVVVEGFTVNGELTGAGNGFTTNNVNTVANSPGDLTLTSAVTSASISNADVDGDISVANDNAGISINNVAADGTDFAGTTDINLTDVSTRTVEVTSADELDTVTSNSGEVTVGSADDERTVFIDSQTTVVVTDDGAEDALTDKSGNDAIDVTVDGLTITSDTGETTVTGDRTGGTPTFAIEADGVTVTDIGVTHDGNLESANVGQALRIAASDVTVDSVDIEVSGGANTGVSVITDDTSNTGVANIDGVEIVDSEFTLNSATTGVLVGQQSDGSFGADPVTITENTFTTAGDNTAFVVDVDNSVSPSKPGDALDLNAVAAANTFSDAEPLVTEIEQDGDAFDAIIADAGEGEVLNANSGVRFTGENAIQDAVTDAGNGDTLRVGAGTFDESVTIDVEGLTLESVDGASPTVSPSSTNGRTDTITASANGVTIQGLTVEATGGSTPRGIVLNADNTAAVNNDVSHADSVPDKSRTGPLIAVAGGDSVTVDGNTATDGPIAYVGGDNKQVAFTNNTIEGDLVDEAFFAFGATGPDITFTGNDFSAAETGDNADVKFDLSATVNGETDDAAIATSVIDSNTGVDDVLGNDEETRTE